MSRHRKLFPVAVWLGGLVVLFGVAGCGDGRIPTYRVSGKVLVDGQPADGAMVIFCPVNPSEELKRERPAGKTDQNGDYQLSTFDKGDGAPAGDYQVMIRWSRERKSQQVPEEYEKRDSTRGPDLLRGRYFHPERSGLTAQVAESDNELPPFELEAPSKRRR